MNFIEVYREQTLEFLGSRSADGHHLRSAESCGAAVRSWHEGLSRFDCRPLPQAADSDDLADLVAEHYPLGCDVVLEKSAPIEFPGLADNIALVARLREIADAAWCGTAERGTDWASVEVWFRSRAHTVACSDLPARAESLRLVHVAIRTRSGDGSGFASMAGTDLAALTIDAAHSAGVAAAEQASSLQDADRPISGHYPVVLSPSASALLIHELVGHALEGDTAARGSALWKRRGTAVAPDFITIIDDNSQPDAWDAASIDDEGNICRAARLVDRGIVHSAMADRMTVSVLPDSALTGHARRTIFASPPQPRSRHTVMEPGKTAIGDMLAGVTDGLLVESVSTADANPATGRFTLRGRAGWEIVGGERRRRLRDFTIDGGLELLLCIEALADDSATAYGMCGRRGGWAPVSFTAPSVLLGRAAVRGRGRFDAA